MSSPEKTTSAAPRSDTAVPWGSQGAKRSSTSRAIRRSGYALSSDGAAIFYEVLGQPQPAVTLFLCDGLGCDGFVWKYLQWALAAEYRIVHMHYRGHGYTPQPADISNISVEDFARDVIAVLDACETESAVLLGHS